MLIRENDKKQDFQRWKRDQQCYISIRAILDNTPRTIYIRFTFTLRLNKKKIKRDENVTAGRKGSIKKWRPLRKSTNQRKTDCRMSGFLSTRTISFELVILSHLYISVFFFPSLNIYVELYLPSCNDQPRSILCEQRQILLQLRGGSFIE